MKTRVSVFAALFAVGVCALQGRADMTITLSDSHGTTGGGEFLATASGFGFVPMSLGQNPPGFEIFCVERNEYINFHDTFYVDINDEAIKGGFGGGNPDPLDAKTAFLYNEFITGQLSGSGWAYDYGSGTARVRSANALQAVIWLIEDEISSLGVVLGSSAELDLAADFLSHAAENVPSGSTDIGNIRVMNLYEDANRTMHAQDQLVAIPAPGGLLLGAIGLALVRKVNR